MDRRAFVATVVMRTSRYGSPLPTITLSARPGTSWRTVNAAVHYLALLAELGTGPAEHWVIGTESTGDQTACVFIETAGSTPAEAERARVMLEDVLIAALLARSVKELSREA